MKTDRAANLFFLTILRQHSQYDSRLGFSFRVLVRVRVSVMVRVDFRVRVGIRVNLTLTLTKTLKLNPNRLSYRECCRNMVMKKKFATGPRDLDGTSMTDENLYRYYCLVMCVTINPQIYDKRSTNVSL